MKTFYSILMSSLLLFVTTGCRQTAEEKFNAKLTAIISQKIKENKQKNSKEAILMYTKTIKNNPNDSNAYYSRGKARFHQEDYSGAISDYTKVIQITHNNVDVYYDRGDAKYLIQDYEGAIADYSKALEMNPGAEDVSGTSEMNNLKNNTVSTSDYFKHGSIDNKNYYAFIWRGDAKLCLKDTTGAIADYTNAIEIDPKNKIAYKLRGVLKYELNDITGAVSDFDKAKQQNEN